MKKLVIKSVILIVLLVGFSSVPTSATEILEPYPEVLQDTKKEIKVAEVPSEVKDAFELDYKDVSIEKAYKISNNTGIYYNLIITVDQQKWEVIYNEKGEYVRKEKVNS